MCIHYGAPRSRSTGKRPNQHYFACGCMARINLEIDREAEEGIVLRITDIDLNHNHEVSETQFGFYPKVRRLSLTEKDDAKKLLKLHVKPADVKATICEATKKRVQTKDILNLARGTVLISIINLIILISFV